MTSNIRVSRTASRFHVSRTASHVLSALMLIASAVAAREELKDARRKSVRLTLRDGARTRDVVVRLRDLV